MKNLASVLSLIVLCLLACKKDRPDFATPVDPGIVASGGSCRITRLTDQFSELDILFQYNEKKNPSVIQIGNFVIPLTYDNQERLMRVDYDTTFFRTYEYTNSDSLPSMSRLYSGNKESPAQLEVYTYDTAGRMLSWDITTYDSGGHAVYTFDYDNNGNLATMIRQGQAEPIFRAGNYDTSRNMVYGNTWLRIFLFSNELGYFPHFLLLLSKNNATEWSFNDQTYGPVFSASSTYSNFNSSGYPTSMTSNVLLGGQVYSGSQVMLFTCD